MLTKSNDILPVEDYVNNKDFYSMRPNLIRSNHGVCFFKVYDNTVYEVSNSGVKAKFQFDFGINPLTPSYIEDNTIDQIFDNLGNGEKFNRISDFRVSDRYLTFHLWPLGKTVVYSKIKKKADLFTDIYDPEIGVYLSDMIGYDGLGEQMIFLLESSSFINNVKETKIKNPNEFYYKAKKMADKLTPNDNPLLIIYDLK